MNRKKAIALCTNSILFRANRSRNCVFITTAAGRELFLGLIDRMVIHGQATLSTGLLGSLVDKGVGLLLLNGRRNRYPAIIQGTFHGDIRRRLRQYRWYAQPDYRLAWSRRLVQFKLLSQLKTLQKVQRMRPDCRKSLFDGIDRWLIDLN
ncbi:MAG: CRISPR-associated endonuclease Cas1 [Methylococcales bacterium]